MSDATDALLALRRFAEARQEADRATAMAEKSESQNVDWLILLNHLHEIKGRLLERSGDAEGAIGRIPQVA